MGYRKKKKTFKLKNKQNNHSKTIVKQFKQSKKPDNGWKEHRIMYDVKIEKEKWAAVKWHECVNTVTQVHTSASANSYTFRILLTLTHKDS